MLTQSFGNGAIAQTVLSSGSDGFELSINIAYGFGVMLGCYVAIGVSGAHMNPAVTLAMALRRKLSWVKVNIMSQAPACCYVYGFVTVNFVNTLYF